MVESVLQTPISAAYWGANFTFREFDGLPRLAPEEFIKEYGILKLSQLKFSEAFLRSMNYEGPSSDEEIILEVFTRLALMSWELNPDQLESPHYRALRNEVERLKTVARTVAQPSFDPGKIVKYISTSYQGKGFANFVTWLKVRKQEWDDEKTKVRCRKTESILVNVRKSLDQGFAPVLAVEGEAFSSTSIDHNSVDRTMIQRLLTKSKVPAHAISTIAYRQSAEGFIYTLRNTHSEGEESDFELSEKQIGSILLAAWVYEEDSSVGGVL